MAVKASRPSVMYSGFAGIVSRTERPASFTSALYPGPTGANQEGLRMPAPKDKGSILGAIARKGLTALHPLGALDGRAGKARATSMVGAAESALMARPAARPDGSGSAAA